MTPSKSKFENRKSKINFDEKDFELHLHEGVTSCSTVVLLDMSGSVTNPGQAPALADAASGATFSNMNPATESTYEPGSTFKIITMAAGLDTHTITPDTAFEDTGSFVVANRVLHNWSRTGFGWETMTQVLQHSANVGAAWVSQRLGRDSFYKYVKSFRFDRPTGVDLPNEGSGLLPLPGDKNWTVVNQFTNAFGQGLSVTPMQLIHAIAAVANGGVMMKPQVVQQLSLRHFLCCW